MNFTEGSTSRSELRQVNSSHFSIPVELALEAGRPLTTGESRGEAGYGAGYAHLERNARPGDRILYVGGHDSLMYPCFGQRLERSVWGVANVEDLGKKLELRPEWVVVEFGALPALREAGVLGALSAGYEFGFRGEVRVILRCP